ncbi:hydroxymethylglutaryl-CoA lyase [Microbacterium sp. ru370.1]|uniref:hydroxymethylglutaryl-CoA lyase n=1 Tax=unclassified Microbacterium TaxID=2609290 RepID=UPI00087E6E08|nr:MULTISPECIES: hydroxymethylglutaryl-CoA lyase [unclassified Microbacterium]SDO25628.1 hydroxymethylglutaryl-CoA lyase [Microbacterium sp. ru370.1]SIT73814.1 hydroxymethylglutaryl-CoA lyase [Microbacterium sp. RU1D]
MSGPAPRQAPRRVAAEGLPAEVTVYEVGPRDGLQAETDVIPTAVKSELCARLYAAGSRALEVTSFVPPAWIPQLADARRVSASVRPPEGARAVALVPNRRGLDDALAAGMREVAVVVSATESFARANLNTDRAGAVARAVAVVDDARSAGIPVRGYVSMAFGDPWEGDVDIAAVVDAAVALHSAGCRTIALGDTIGVATAGHVEQVVEAVTDAGIPRSALALHLHDTYGQALANVLAGLRAGVTEFDASVGGLGRCPYAPGATGNLATEDLAWMLEGLGIRTGLDIPALARTSAWLAGVRGRPHASRVAHALTTTPEEHPA